MYVAAMCPRFGNPWKKGKAFFQEYVLRNTRYYEIPVSLLRVLLNNRVLVGATYHATHNTNLVQQSYSYIYIGQSVLAARVIIGENSYLQIAMSHHGIFLNVCRWELKSQRFRTSRWRHVNT